jgi:hypothetical protein
MLFYAGELPYDIRRSLIIHSFLQATFLCFENRKLFFLQSQSLTIGN